MKRLNPFSVMLQAEERRSFLEQVRQTARSEYTPIEQGVAKAWGSIEFGLENEW